MNGGKGDVGVPDVAVKVQTIQATLAPGRSSSDAEALLACANLQGMCFCWSLCIEAQEDGTRSAEPPRT